MIHQQPPKTNVAPVADTGIASHGAGYDTQVQRRFAGATHLTPACADIKDLVQQLDQNAIKNITVKAGRDDFRAP